MNKFNKVIINFLTNDNKHINKKNEVIIEFIEFAKSYGKQIYFLKKTQSLDVDTKGKDSDKLFKSGLDYITLTTGKHRYTKSKNDFIKHINIPENIDWLIQDCPLNIVPNHSSPLVKAPNIKIFIIINEEYISIEINKNRDGDNDINKKNIFNYKESYITNMYHWINNNAQF